MTLHAKARHFDGGETAAPGALLLDEEGVGWRVLDRDRDAGWLTLERADDYDALLAHEENVRRAEHREATRHLRDPRIVEIDSALHEYEVEMHREYSTPDGACCRDCVHGGNPRYVRLRNKIDRVEKWRAILAEKLRVKCAREKRIGALDVKRGPVIRQIFNSA